MKTTDITPEFIMLIGAPASGKSTFIQQLLADNPDKNYVVLSTDDILTAWGDAEGLSYSEAFEKYMSAADKEFKAQFRKAIETRSNMVIDRTNMTAKGRAKFLNQLPKEYHTKAVVFNVDRDELDRRMTKREIETGKTVPAHVVTSMLKSFTPPTNAEFDEIVNV